MTSSTQSHTLSAPSTESPSGSPGREEPGASGSNQPDAAAAARSVTQGAAAAPPTIATLLPALVAVGGLVAVVSGALDLVGATDLPSLTRGAPWPTFGGASLLLAAVITAGVGLVFTRLRRWLTLGAYAAAALGLILYVIAAVHVTSDPAAPQITIEPVVATEETKVSATVSGLAFNERLQLSATFSDTEVPFARRVLGAGGDGAVEHELVVPAQSESRRLQVTASVLRHDEIRRDFECNDADAGRTCSEAAWVIPRGTPEVRAKLRGGILNLTVLDKRRIPGLLVVRVMRRGNEIYATRTRVGKPVFRTALRLGVRAGGRRSMERDIVCVAAAYSGRLPKCSARTEAETITRLHPTGAQLRPS